MRHPDLDEEINANIVSLNKLRNLPKGSGTESRIKAIKELLGDREIFRTIHNLRWPHGVVCPRCHSTNIIMAPPPEIREDKRYYYQCIECEINQTPCFFDDLTDLPIEGGIEVLRQWILCWYLIGFCSITQIAKVLGLSVSEIQELLSLGANIVDIPEKGMLGIYKTKKSEQQEEKRLEQIDD